jgi:hypothetical protein
MADQSFDHKKLDLYCLSIEYVGGTIEVAGTLSGGTPIRKRVSSLTVDTRRGTVPRADGVGVHYHGSPTPGHRRPEEGLVAHETPNWFSRLATIFQMAAASARRPVPQP